MIGLEAGRQRVRWGGGDDRDGERRSDGVRVGGEREEEGGVYY